MPVLHEPVNKYWDRAPPPDQVPVPSWLIFCDQLPLLQPAQPDDGPHGTKSPSAGGCQGVLEFQAIPTNQKTTCKLLKEIHPDHGRLVHTAHRLSVSRSNYRRAACDPRQHYSGASEKVVWEQAKPLPKHPQSDRNCESETPEVLQLFFVISLWKICRNYLPYLFLMWPVWKQTYLRI